MTGPSSVPNRNSGSTDPNPTEFHKPSTAAAKTSALPRRDPIVISQSDLVVRLHADSDGRVQAIICPVTDYGRSIREAFQPDAVGRSRTLAVDPHTGIVLAIKKGRILSAEKRIDSPVFLTIDRERCIQVEKKEIDGREALVLGLPDVTNKGTVPSASFGTGSGSESTSSSTANPQAPAARRPGPVDESATAARSVLIAGLQGDGSGLLSLERQRLEKKHGHGRERGDDPVTPPDTFHRRRSSSWLGFGSQ